MQLRRLEIENFRGIKKLDLKLKDTNVLIGENNVGKTSILEALRFVLFAVRTNRGCAFNKYDFYFPHANTEPVSVPAISIRVTFEEDEKGQWSKEQITRLNRMRVLQFKEEEEHALVVLKVGACVDEKTKEFTQNWEFQGVDGSKLTSVADSVLPVFRNEVSFYYLSALRDVAKQFNVKGAYWKSFLKESQLPPEKHKEIEDKLAEVNDLVISSHTSFSKVVSHLEEIKQVISTVGNGADTISIDAVPERLFDMLSNAAVNIKARSGAMIPAVCHGEGMQSLAVLMLFNAYLTAFKTGGAIVAVEELEAHLHPGAIRSLWKLIDNIPGQKLISTHSGNLLSEIPPEFIVRLGFEEQETKAYLFSDINLEDEDKRKFNTHLRRDRGELLFSRCWILVEGQSEETLIPECARILGKDFECAGIHCITYQTGISLKTCLKIADGMGIKWLVLIDGDVQGKASTQTVRAHLGKLSENKVLFSMNEKDIEKYLKNNGFGEIYSSPKCKNKVKAIDEVISCIKNDKSKVPQLIRDIIEAAFAEVHAT